MVDWHLSTDLLHCSPQFYNKPRYDFVLIKCTDSDFFAQLIYVFTCQIGQDSHGLALIQPFDAPVPGQRKDNDLRFHRVKARP